MELSGVIAANLKFLRTERNLSLGQLAEVSGVSKVMLSQIEKGESNPTINTIWKIANGLKVPYTRLIDEIKNEAAVIRKTGISPQVGENPSYTAFCYYKTTPLRNFELFHVELGPRSSNSSIGHTAKSQEYILVTCGELLLNTADQEYALQEGDSMFFDPSMQHAYSNRQDSKTTFIVINYYP